MLQRIGCLVLLLMMAVLARAAERDGPPAYPNHRQLDFWLDGQGDRQPIKTPDEWAKRRAHILQGIQQAMGKLPDRSNLVPLDPRITDTVAGPGFTRYTLSIAAEGDDRVPCYLLVPKGLEGKRVPGILALHQTQTEGKGSPVGLAGRENLHYGLELVKRGYVVLAPDYPSFGDYQYDFSADNYTSGSMKGIFNHMRCVDFLQSRPEVDPERIGAMGHSLGGHNAIFVGVFDPRIKVIVSSCGWTPFHDYYGGKLDGWTSDRYVPSIRDAYKLDPDRVPFDLYEMVAALAPRAFFSNSPLHDGNFEVEGVRKVIAQVKPIYEMLGAGNRLQVRYPDDGHEFTPSVRHESYEFIDLILEHTARENIGAELPRIPPHEPADALSTFSVQPGFRIEQVAAEPLVASPVAMAFDADGRLYVVEMRDYSEQDQERLGRVRLVEDTDGDGKFDKAAVFADDLSWPTAVACYGGGVFVGAAPDIYYLKDTTGDGRADVRQLVYTGFARNNVQGLLNSFHWGLDNRIHGTASSNGGTVSRPDAPDVKPVSVSGRDFSFDPRTFELRAESGGAQHGMSFDDWGRKFVCSNSDHIQMVMFEDRYLARNPHVTARSARVSIAADGPQAEVFRTSPVEPWRIVRTRLRVTGAAQGPVEGGGRAGGYFTGATGTTIYRGGAWPAEFVGQSFTGDVGSNIVHRKMLKPDGVGFIADRADKGREFVASTDSWFRPAQFANGPDGNLYIIDVYREVIEHPLSLPPEIKQHLDLTSGRDRGRIYRVVPEGYRQTVVAKLDSASTIQLAGSLESRNGWTRDTAARLIFERQDHGAVAALERVASRAKLPQGRMHAVYALAGLESLSPPVLVARLADDDPRVREHAVRLSERLAGKSAELRAALVELADDRDIRVRYQLAFTLGEFDDLRGPVGLAKILLQDPADPWIRLAAFSSLDSDAGQLFQLLVSQGHPFANAEAGSELLADLARMIGRRNRREELDVALSALDGLAGDLATQAAVVRGLGEGLAKGPGTLAERFEALGSKKAQRVLTDLVADSRSCAAEASRPTAERVEAIRTLALDGFDDCGELLASLVSINQPQDVQAAALNTLGGFSDPAVARTIVDAWPNLSPRLRIQAAETIFSRAAWLSEFVEAAEQQKVSLADVDPARLSVLEKHPDRQIRERARPLLANVKLGRRPDVVEAYRVALTAAGDPSRGRAVFQKVCAACHRLEGVGHEIGPNLASFRTRGAEAILVNVLDPNREVNPQYLNYVLITREGRSLTGMVAAETATSVTLKRAEALTDTVPRGEIEALRSSNLSIMPEGLEKEIEPAAMADLLAYLMHAL